jgi:hypothetical protein
MPNPRVFIMGAGFGGLPAVKKLGFESCPVPARDAFYCPPVGVSNVGMPISVPMDASQPIQSRHAT